MADKQHNLEHLQHAMDRFRGDVLAIDHDSLAKHAMRAGMLGFDFDAPSPLRVEKQGGLAIFYVEGVMVPEAEWPGEVSTQELIAALERAEKEENVTSGLLLFNTPGGAVLGMAELLAAEKSFASKKPLFAHASGLCCSGGYWAAMPARKLFASPGSVLGSIGVRSQLVDSSKMLEQLGIEQHDITTGPLKGTGVPGSAVTEEQKLHVRERVDFTFAAFRGDVSVSRNLRDSALEEVTTGGSWYVEQAIATRLHDGIQTVEKTIHLVGAESATTSVPVLETKTMADDATKEPAGPQPATLKQLKEKFATSTAEWREEQIEAGATLTDAAIAFANHQAERATALEEERDQAKADAEKAAAEANKPKNDKPNKSRRGVPALNSSAGEGDDSNGSTTDYRQMAVDYMQKRNCRWSEACLAIKKRYPESRAAFGAPPVREQ